ncbi:MAG: hypothetical protein M1825_002196 [Sarcosagium campestre]|nr:MAG: hypothetical protein M1825_002196 [Sarcosagium campestre]
MPPKATQRRTVQGSSREARDERRSLSVTESVRKQNSSVKVQQQILDIFNAGFCSPLAEDLRPLVQEVKGHLYCQNWHEAFGKEDYLRAYAARWSPSRALAYLEAFLTLRRHLSHGSQLRASSQDERTDSKQSDAYFKVTCLGGGGGGEVVGLAALNNYATHIDGTNDPEQESNSTGQCDQSLRRMAVSVVDISNWTTVIDTLKGQLYTPPTISKYASAAARADAAPALVSEDAFAVSFHQEDALKLSSSKSSLKQLVGDSNLVTMMFVLNELYAESVSRTTSMLLLLAGVMKEGALLLVIGSAGRDSTVSIGKKGKLYPVQWLFEHTMLEDTEIATEKDLEPSDEGKRRLRWEKVVGYDSQWFRLSAGLKYPVDLEDMRHQTHLYKLI